MAKSKFKFTNNFKDLDKRLESEEKRVRSKAARYLAKKLKEVTIERYGEDSNITKGVRYSNRKKASFVGLGPPAYAGVWEEFGTDERYSKTGKPAGHVTAKPFVLPTFEREAPEVKRIMSDWSI